MKNYETAIAEILEVPSVEMNDELKSYESWDSLTILSLIAYASEEFKVELSRDSIENAKTIIGLKSLIKNSMNQKTSAI